MKTLAMVLFGGAGGRTWSADAGLLVLRVFAGISLMWAHGRGKMPPSEQFIDGVGEMGFPVPIVFAWGASLAEYAGGVLLALGFLTRPAAFMILCTMTVAALVRHQDDAYGVKERALLYGVVALAFLFIGAGRISVDALARRWAGAPAA